MTFAIETGEWSILFRRQTLLTLLVILPLLITHSAALSMPSPHHRAMGYSLISVGDSHAPQHVQSSYFNSFFNLNTYTDRVGQHG